ncbi:MAG: hypothetical protein ACJAQ6_001020 [Arenicella sp.]|jgi:uncharacterized protein YgiM (DUF1202 family)
MSSAGYSQPGAASELPTTEFESEYQEELDKWMLQAYEGDRDAQFKVGVLFTNDQFQTADMEQAVYWYKQAARQGHALSQYNLGHQYLTGTGVKRNENEAMRWWLKAAEQDHPLAQFNIGRAYYLGIGLDEDLDQSRFWFKRAAQNNEPKSIDILEQLKWSEPGEYQAAVERDTTDALVAEQLAPSTITAEALTPTITAEALTPTTIDDVANTVAVSDAAESPATAIEISDAQSEVATSTVATDLKSPIALYTNPAKRSVLISIFDAREQLTIISTAPEWTKVASDTGFRVWVHQDYIVVADDIGTISGNAVNARAVPLIINGTIVGRLNDAEMLEVLDKKNAWYRVTSPSRFKAWVKTDEFNRNKTLTTIAQSPASRSDADGQADSKGGLQNSQNESITDDNKWLFSQPADGYTLQLASFDDTENVAAFKSRKKFRNNRELHSFTSSAKDIQWTYFLYGAFESSEAAKQSRIEIGQKLAWVRSFGKLQQNRCLAWKKKIPTPKQLNKYCA